MSDAMLLFILTPIAVGLIAWIAVLLHEREGRRIAALRAKLAEAEAARLSDEAAVRDVFLRWSNILRALRQGDVTAKRDDR